MSAPEHERQNVILDSINEGVFTVDMDWRITSFNRAAESITGVPREEALGQRCSEVFRASICESRCALRHSMETGKPGMDVGAFIVDADGERIPIKISAAALNDDEGRIVGGVETFQDLRQVEALRQQLRDRHTVGDIVAQSPAMTRVLSLLPRIAESESTVLVQGASGTGKELLAHAIHDLSPRADGPFVAVNCGALPDTLLESEHFGHERGAFTGATARREGRFAAAHKGTLFLDEIGDVSPAMQVRLLRVLEEHVFEPLGSNTPVEVDVRLVAATHRDIDALVREGTFREDLLFRLDVMRVGIPPLSERREDIALLVDRFVSKFNALTGKDVSGLSPEASAILLGHSYPGNVRELRNIIEHAFVLVGSGPILPAHLPAHLTTGSGEGPAHALDLSSMERILIERALRRHAGHRGRAARDLGIDTSTLYRKIKRLGIEAPETDGRGSR
jgi:PAS domain S-box-containing protein